MSEPVLVVVKRWKCPTCPRTHSNKSRAREHMARCWSNPEVRGCKTCKHFDVDLEDGDGCNVGVDLTGRGACTRCLGQNYVATDEIFRPRFAAPGRVMALCPECGGNGNPVKPGPIVHCSQWEPSSEYATTSPN